MTKPVSATMRWKGRKLLCNGVCVADLASGFNCFSGFGYHIDLVRATEQAARRAINRRFKLPLDFGDR